VKNLIVIINVHKIKVCLQSKIQLKMQQVIIPKSSLEFLNLLNKNNNREWFNANIRLPTVNITKNYK
jgi:hypothetical protein